MRHLALTQPLILIRARSTAYMPDVFTLLGGMNSSNLEHTFYSAKVSLADFLLITDERLKEIGVEFPYQRKRILLGLMKFHVAKYSADSLPQPMDPDGDVDLLRLFDIVSACVKHLTVLNCSMQFIQRKDIFGDKAATPESFECLAPLAREIERELDAIRKRVEDLEAVTPKRPPLHIDQSLIDELKRKTPFRRQIIKTLWTGAAIFCVGAVVLGIMNIRH